MLECPACKRPIDVIRFFDSLTAYAPAFQVATFECPECHAATEVQVESGVVWFGYFSGAGTAHFTGMVRVTVPALMATAGADALEVELEGRTWRIATAS